ncbi:MAG: acyl-CoA thioesterase [Candidatus Binatia bacterium]
MLKHVEKMRVRWVDTDASGRIHYTAAFRYFEVAEWELFRKAGFPLRSHDEEFGLPRVDVQASFHSMLSVDDEIAVHIEVLRLGNTSVSFGYTIYKEQETTPCVSGQVTAVFIDTNGRPIPIPDRIRHALSDGIL